MPLDFKFLFFFNIREFFLFLDPFEILSLYAKTDSIHWIMEEVQRIVYKVFREELMI